MRLFILFIPFLLLHSPDAYSQQGNQFENLPRNQQKLIKKKIGSMSIEDKVLSFICLQKKYEEGYEGQIGGILFNSSDSQHGTITRLSTELLSFFNLAQVKYYHDTPFPSVITRNEHQDPLPIWLPSVFSANYLIDIDTSVSDILFYGIDSTGVYAITTPYHTWDSLLSTTLKHDLIYYPQSPDSLLYQLKKIKAKGRSKRTLDDKLRVKNAQGLVKRNQQKPPSQKAVVQWIWQSYTSSISLKYADEILPIRTVDDINLCSFSFDNNQFKYFSEALNRYAPVPLYTPGKSVENNLARLSAYDLVIIPTSQLKAEQKAFVLALANKTNVLLVEFESNKADFSENKHISSIYVPQNNWLSQSLAAQTIFGATLYDSCTNKLKYGYPELVGMDLDSLKMIDEVVEEAIKQKAIPGCQILVVKDGIVVWNMAYGYQTYDSIISITQNTLYDLASITKVLATTQGIMYLLENDTIDLDQPLSNYLDYLRNTNKKDITIRQIMAHQAGLYPYYPFWKKAREVLKMKNSGTNNEIQVGKGLWVNSAVTDSILSWVAISDLLTDRTDTITHEQYFYSDIGFYLLKDLIEQQTAMPFDKFLTEHLYQPLGTKLVFNPTCYFPVENMAPTEIDNELRHEVVQGFVHDRNAALLGGVAGQAGLFGNANDVAIMLQLQLNGGCYGGRRYFQSATIKQFLSRQYDNNRRGLGWDMPGPEPDGPVSELASNEAFGHTGFTGGAIWADPKERLIFVFLSNRVYPSVENTKLIDMNIRTRIQDIVYRSIIK